MIDLYLTDISDLKIKHEYIDRLTIDRAQKLNRIKPGDDKKRCLGAGLLLEDFVIRGRKSLYRIDEKGRPYMEQGGYFNLSHSGKYVLLGVSDSEIGCDIERCRDKDFLKLAKIIFHPNEIKTIENSENQKDCFFALWTKKEAFLKATGQGFHRKSTRIDLSGSIYEENSKSYWFRHYDIEDYKICVCSLKNDFPKTIKIVKY